MTLDEPIKTLGGCTGYVVGLEIPNYSLARKIIPSDQRVFGADFDAVYGGICKGRIRFELRIDRDFDGLPIGPDTGAPFSIARAVIDIEFSGEADGCSRLSCTAPFAVSIDRAPPRDTDSDGGKQ